MRPLPARSLRDSEASLGNFRKWLDRVQKRERKRGEKIQREIPSRGWSLASYVLSPSPSSSVVHIFSRELWFFVPLVEGGGTVNSATRRDKNNRQGKWNYFPLIRTFLLARHTEWKVNWRVRPVKSRPIDNRKSEVMNQLSSSTPQAYILTYISHAWTSDLSSELKISSMISIIGYKLNLRISLLIH